MVFSCLEQSRLLDSLPLTTYMYGSLTDYLDEGGEAELLVKNAPKYSAFWTI